MNINGSVTSFIWNIYWGKVMREYHNRHGIQGWWICTWPQHSLFLVRYKYLVLILILPPFLNVLLELFLCLWCVLMNQRFVHSYENNENINFAVEMPLIHTCVFCSIGSKGKRDTHLVDRFHIQMIFKYAMRSVIWNSHTSNFTHFQ